MFDLTFTFNSIAYLRSNLESLELLIKPTYDMLKLNLKGKRRSWSVHKLRRRKIFSHLTIFY